MQIYNVSNLDMLFYHSVLVSVVYIVNLHIETYNWKLLALLIICKILNGMKVPSIFSI